MSALLSIKVTRMAWSYQLDRGSWTCNTKLQRIFDMENHRPRSRLYGPYQPLDHRHGRSSHLYGHRGRCHRFQKPHKRYYQHYGPCSRRNRPLGRIPRTPWPSLWTQRTPSTLPRTLSTPWMFSRNPPPRSPLIPQLSPQNPRNFRSLLWTTSYFYFIQIIKNRVNLVGHSTFYNLWTFI